MIQTEQKFLPITLIEYLYFPKNHYALAMKKIHAILFLFCFIIGWQQSHAQQNCTYDGTLNSDTDIGSIPAGDWDEGAACVAAIASGTVTGTITIDMGNNDVLSILQDLTVNGSFLITGGPGSGLTVGDASTPYDLQIGVDLGDNNNNGVIYSVPNSGSTINADGTVYGKNNNDFNGNGQISGGTLNVKNGSTCASPCPVTGNFDDCINGAGQTFCDDNSVVVPIVLGKFESVHSEKNVVLEWETISEENFDFFSVERSEDGKTFYEIGTVPGNGNSNDRIQYSYTDEQPLFGLAYYRLNAIDFDGSYEKFQILPVEFIPEDLHVGLYPNPGTASVLTVNLGLPAKARLQKLSVYDWSGIVLYETLLVSGRNEVALSSSMPAGIYFAKIQIDNYVTTKKVIIE